MINIRENFIGINRDLSELKQLPRVFFCRNLFVVGELYVPTTDKLSVQFVGNSTENNPDFSRNDMLASNEIMMD